jgi:uncharacterized protein (DUF58 family)
MSPAVESVQGEVMVHCVERLASFLNHDFCPWANRYVYWLKQPVGWFALGAAAALVIGISVATQALIVCAALIAVALIGIAWPRIAMRAVSCSLSFDRPRATEGSVVRVRIAVSNRWPWPLWGLMVERGFFLPADGEDSKPAASLARVAGWSRTVFEWEFCPPRRGRYPLETPRLATGFPFGLWQAQAEIDVEDELLVWPRTACLQSIPPILGESLSIAAAHSRHVGDEGDVTGLRPFRHGDSLRHVHWSQTARHDRLVVCERQASARRRVQLIFDTGAERQPGRSSEACENLIRVVASIGRQFHSHHADTQLCLGDRFVLANPGERGLKQMMDALAVWSPDGKCECETCRHDGADRALAFVVTTPARVAEWRCKFQRDRDTQFVVLDAYGEGPKAAVARQQPDDCSSLRRACLVIDGREDPLMSLTRRWEQLCHDGWSHN